MSGQTYEEKSPAGSALYGDEQKAGPKGMDDWKSHQDVRPFPKLQQTVHWILVSPKSKSSYRTISTT